MPPAIYQALDARYVAGRHYVLKSPFEFDSAIKAVGRFIVPAEFHTNFHSTPRILWPVFPPDDYAESSVAHDYAYRFGGVHDYKSGELRKLTRNQADLLHRELLIHCGASEKRGNAMYAGLRIGGWKSWNAYRAGKVVPL